MASSTTCSSAHISPSDGSAGIAPFTVPDWPWLTRVSPREATIQIHAIVR